MLSRIRDWILHLFKYTTVLFVSSGKTPQFLISCRVVILDFLFVAVFLLAFDIVSYDSQGITCD